MDSKIVQPVSVAAVNCIHLADENCTVQLGGFVSDRGAAHVRAGAPSAVTSLPGAGTAIARTLRVSRRTVYHWINTGQLDRELDAGPVQYTPRPPVPRKIDRYCGVIQARLSEYPRLRATRLYEEIRVGGYAGGLPRRPIDR
jgi:hypothetical protein